MLLKLRIVFVFILFAFHLKSQDSLQIRLDQATPEDQVIILADAAWEIGFSDPGAADSLAQKGLRIAESLKDSAIIAYASNDAATAAIRLGQYGRALDLNKRALRIRTNLGDSAGIGSSLSKIGVIFTEQGILDSAIGYQMKALNIFEARQDSVYVAQTLSNLSTLFEKSKDVDRAMDYGIQAIELLEQLDYPYALGQAYANMSNLKDELNEFDECLDWGEKALKIFEEIDSKMDIALILNNMGFAHRKRGNQEVGLNAYRRALSIAEEIQDESGIAQYSANIGAVMNDLGRPNEAIPYYERSLQLALKNNIRKVINQCYEGIANSYGLLGRYQEALENHRLFTAYKDSTYSEDIFRVTADLETKYQTEKKEQENILVKRENQILSLTNQKTKTRLYSAVGLFALLAVLGFLFYSRNKAKREAEFNQNIIKEREQGLKAVFNAIEDERKRIARELHDGIGQQLSGLKLAWEKLSTDIPAEKEEEKNRLSKLSGILDDACTDVRSISHQMMPRALSEMGLVPAIEDMLEKSLGQTDVNYEFEHFKIDGRYDEKVEIGVYRICQELINNVIKHSGAKTVHVQLFHPKNQLILIVEDDGKGFSPDAKKDGIGLMNISSRLNTVNGEVNYEPSPGSGTVATIRIPVVR